jgi:hypothetical protein
MVFVTAAFGGIGGLLMGTVTVTETSFVQDDPLAPHDFKCSV